MEATLSELEEFDEKSADELIAIENHPEMMDRYFRQTVGLLF